MDFQLNATRYDGVDVRKCLPGLNSKKAAGVTPARVQGLEENVRRLRTGPVMNELVNHPEWMPLLLDDKGEVGGGHHGRCIYIYKNVY